MSLSSHRMPRACSVSEDMVVLLLFLQKAEVLVASAEASLNQGG